MSDSESRRKKNKKSKKKKHSESPTTQSRSRVNIEMRILLLNIISSVFNLWSYLFYLFFQSSSLRRSDLDEFKIKKNLKSSELSDDDLEAKRKALLAQLHDEMN